MIAALLVGLITLCPAQFRSICKNKKGRDGGYIFFLFFLVLFILYILIILVCVRLLSICCPFMRYLHIPNTADLRILLFLASASF